MNQELPPGQEDDEIQGLTQIVADSLAKGEDPQSIAQKLIDSGWEPDQAHGYVASVQHHLATPRKAASSESSELQGWLVWGGGILLINFLSWMFNWGFWIY